MATLDRRTFLCAQALSVLGAAALKSGIPALAAEPGAVGGVAGGGADVKTGGSRMISIDGKYRVWTKRVGSGPIKVLTLHGGPGATHEYLECFEDFLPQHGIEFYYYDQLGSGNSDQPEDKSLWTIDRFLGEVEQVRVGLGLEKFHLFGHSWGGMLGIEYALKYPQHLNGLVISNMTASISSYVAYVNELRKAFPSEVKAILEKYESKGDYEAPEYQEAIFGYVYQKHLCRLDPWPEPLERTVRHLNNQVYNTMQGPNEFVVNGTFKDWDRWKDIGRIKVPTLLMGARYDEMSPDDIRRMHSDIPGSRLFMSETGSHMAMYDDQENYFKALVGFLTGRRDR